MGNFGEQSERAERAELRFAPAARGVWGAPPPRKFFCTGTQTYAISPQSSLVDDSCRGMLMIPNRVFSQVFSSIYLGAKSGGVNMVPLAPLNHRGVTLNSVSEHESCLNGSRQKTL